MNQIGLLPNEVQIDIAGKSKEDVLKEAIGIIDHFEPLTEYKYELDDEHNIYPGCRVEGWFNREFRIRSMVLCRCNLAKTVI